MQLLHNLDAQVFITAIEETLIKGFDNSLPGKTFQIEQGRVTEK